MKNSVSKAMLRVQSVNGFIDNSHLRSKVMERVQRGGKKCADTYVSGVFCVKCVSKNKKERCKKKKKVVVRPAMCYRLETAVLSRKTSGGGGRTGRRLLSVSMEVTGTDTFRNDKLRGTFPSLYNHHIGLF